jgi:putative ABC transport system ATP-binding protein
VPPLFELTDVVVGEDGSTRLGPISLQMPDEGVTVLAGPSGAGKSTLLRLCNRLEVPASGRVAFRGADLDDVDPLALRRQVGMVFQRPILFPGTVEDNLRVADPQADAAALVAAMERAGLDRSFLSRVGDDLSGGEAQRACLARTLLTDPEALLLDEPTSALDPPATRQLERLARSLATDGVPMVWVSHDLEQVRRVADRTIVLVAGRVATAADAEAYLDSGRRGG